MSKNWQMIQSKYKGLWVALKDDEETVIGSGKTAKEALKEAKEKGYQEPVLAKIPEALVTYVGLS